MRTTTGDLGYVADGDLAIASSNGQTTQDLRGRDRQVFRLRHCAQGSARCDLPLASAAPGGLVLGLEV